MGKKAAQNGPGVDTVPQVQQKELYQRVNYTFQASAFLQNLASSSTSESSSAKQNKCSESANQRSNNVDLEVLAKAAMKSTKRMAGHTQLKL